MTNSPMHNINSTYKPNNSIKSSSMNNNTNNGDTITRMHPSMKRPRAPIACYRCHHKKVRCDGIHPNCTRCLSTGVLCAYPSSRRSRNTQPTNVDPFIDNLSQLEARIRRIETDLESQRALVRTVCTDGNSSSLDTSNNSSALASRMLKTEKDLQESRSIVAQLRLRGEQRAARGRRAAAASAAAASVSTTLGPDKNTSVSGKSANKDAGHQTAKSRNNKLRVSSHLTTKKDNSNMIKSHYSASTKATTVMDYSNSASPPFYFTQSDSNSPVDFINPPATYYFPTCNNTDMTTPICNNGNPFSMMVGDWPLLNDLPHTTVPSNSFVDPMIIAAAEGGIAPPLLSVSSYLVDEETSIMAARARSLSHLPNNNQNMMAIPGLQPSSSSTSTCSNGTSISFNNNYMYDATNPNCFTQFMDNASNGENAMMMLDQHGMR